MIRFAITFLVSFLFLAANSQLFAGDAVAIGYNSDGVWTSVTYYSSSQPKGSKDYKTEAEARDEALRDLKKRGDQTTTRTEILSSSDSTGFVAVARGHGQSARDTNVVGRGKSKAEADENAMAELKKGGRRKIKGLFIAIFPTAVRAALATNCKGSVLLSANGVWPLVIGPELDIFI